MINALLFERPIWFTTGPLEVEEDRKSTRLNSSHSQISYAVFCLKKKNNRVYLDAACPELNAWYLDRAEAAAAGMVDDALDNRKVLANEQLYDHKTIVELEHEHRH